MDYEQKYKEALERAKELKNKLEKNCSLATPTGIETIFPELAVSEDERIRKELIRLLNVMTDGIIENYTPIPLRDLVAWIEKQGEQNPVWSKEDITNYSKVLFCLQTLTFPTDDERKELITWLKKQGEHNSADSYCQENCKGFQETGKCFADGECKAKREAGQICRPFL